MLRLGAERGRQHRAAGHQVGQTVGFPLVGIIGWTDREWPALDHGPTTGGGAPGLPLVDRGILPPAVDAYAFVHGSLRSRRR